LTGSIPRELGNLSQLEEIYLNLNLLGGPLPQTLTSLANLVILYFDVDRQCVPGNAAFQAWLAGIPSVSAGGALCRWGYLPAVIR